MSTPDGSCNAFYHKDVSMKVVLIVGIILILVSLLYLALATQEGSPKVIKVGQSNAVNNGVLENKKEAEKEDEIDDEESKKTELADKKDNAQTQQVESKIPKELEAYQSNVFINFHIIMFAASV